MNLKRTLFTGLAAAGLMASIATPMAMAQATEDGPNANSITGTVVVTSTGVFDVYFCEVGVVGGLPAVTGVDSAFDLTAVTLDSTNPSGVATGSLIICYDDTKAHRDKFNVRLSASDFALTTNTNYTIPASGFTITSTTGIAQQNSGNSPIDYGDIGTFVNEADPNGQPSPITSAPWTANSSLDGTGRKVHFGYAGVGTTVSGGGVEVALQVPSTTVAGTYQSQLTLSVVVGGNP